MNRRSFIYNISILSAGIAMSCKRPRQEIFTSVNPVENTQFSEFDYYNTFLPTSLGVYKLLVKVYEGKPIQILTQKLKNGNNSYIDFEVLNDIYNLYNYQRFREAKFKDDIIKKDDIINYCSEVITRKLKDCSQTYIILEYRNSPALNRLTKIINNYNRNIKVIGITANKYIELSNISENLLNLNEGELIHNNIIEIIDYMNNKSDLNYNELLLVKELINFKINSNKYKINPNKDLSNILYSDSILISSYDLNKINIDFNKLKDFIYLSQFDEINSLINVPKSHFLEDWADSSNIFGDYAIQQATVSRLNPDSFSDIELIFDIFKNLGVEELQQYEEYFDFIKDNYHFNEILHKGNHITNIKNSMIELNSALVYNMLKDNYNTHTKQSLIENNIINPFNIYTEQNEDNFIKNYLKRLSKIQNYYQQDNFKYLNEKWGLLIDIDLCNNCKACVSACRFENNIPYPEKSDNENRDMDWISIIKSRNLKNQIKYIPYMCQHCENAPCEAACPVNAATHSPQGLSESIYNRCIGTRYCMAACQYKVRKFNYKNNYKNFDNYQKSRLNPNVTTRSRGVVEKCSMCVQRINEYNTASKNDKKVNKIQTACSEVCPLKAIKLVDLNSKEFIEFKNLNKDNLYQIIVNSATKPSIYYIMRD